MPLGDATAGTSAVALLTLSAVAIAVSVAVCRSKLQQLATADTLVTPDTVYKMYGVTQQQSCVVARRYICVSGLNIS